MTIAQPLRVVAFNDWVTAQGWKLWCDPSLAFVAAPLADLLAIWQAQAGSDRIPPKSKLSARVLKPHLRYIALFQQVTGRRYCVRLMGSQLSRTFGEMQGKFVDEVVPPELVARWHGALDLTLAEGRPLRFTSTVAFPHLDYLQSEIFLAPLLDKQEMPSLVLGGAVLKSSAQDPKSD